MNLFGDFMFLYFDDVICVLFGDLIYYLIFFIVVRIYVIFEKLDMNFCYFQMEFGFCFGDD